MNDGKTYKIDKSKKAMSEEAWGNIDKNQLRNKIMEARNKSVLVKAVYMLVGDGWEEAPSEHLKYPVMCFEGDTLVYNKGGLSSALGYAKKENETTVVNKINKIYKNLGLDQDGKEEDAKMVDVNFEIEGRKAWADVIKKIQDHEGDGAYVDSIEDNHIIYTKDNVRYRVEADIKVDKDDKSIDANIKWDTVKRDADQKMAETEVAEEKKMFDDCDCEDGHDHDDGKVEMSVDEMKAEMARLQCEIEDRDNIIMEKDTKMGEMEKELSELREYKVACEKKELATSVESIMTEVKDCMSEDKYKEFRDEGLTCKISELYAWSNKVKAFCLENGKVSKIIKKNDSIFSFAAPVENNQKPMNVWERLKNL